MQSEYRMHYPLAAASGLQGRQQTGIGLE